MHISFFISLKYLFPFIFYLSGGKTYQPVLVCCCCQAHSLKPLYWPSIPPSWNQKGLVKQYTHITRKQSEYAGSNHKLSHPGTYYGDNMQRSTVRLWRIELPCNRKEWNL